VKAWLEPKELQKSEHLRLVLGVLLEDGQEVSPENYLDLHQQKVWDLLKQEAPQQAVRLLAVAVQRPLPEGENPQEVYLENLEWQDLPESLSWFLKGRISRQDLEQLFRLKERSLGDLPNPERFLQGLQDLDLAEYLDLAISG
jgi:hypothetical protein